MKEHSINISYHQYHQIIIVVITNTEKYMQDNTVSGTKVLAIVTLFNLINNY